MPDDDLNNGRRYSITHGLISLASIFTVGRLVCGFFAINSTYTGLLRNSAMATRDAGSGAFDRAACAIFIGILCDGLDGLVARLTGRASDFGREMDSLVDIVTFGMAPALLGLFWGVLPAQQSLAGSARQALGVAGWIAACAFLVSGVGRLARFNLMQETESNKDHALGLAIPCAAAVVAAIIHIVKHPIQTWPFALGWLGLYVFLSFLMVSRLQYETLRAFPHSLRRGPVLLLLGILAVWLVWLYSGPVLLAAAAGYAISGPLAYLTNLFRSQHQQNKTGIPDPEPEARRLPRL